VTGSCSGPLCAEQARVRQTVDGDGLCASCRSRLAGQLQVLPGLYQRCEGILVNRRAAGFERIRGGLPGGINLNDAAAAVRAKTMSVLASWAGLVVDERRLSKPPRRDVRSLARFLTKQLDWLAGHPAAGDAAAEIAGLVQSAEDAISPRGAARMELGPCDRSGCGGTVLVTARGDSGTGSVQVGCDAGHMWPTHRWLMLQHRIEQSRSDALADHYSGDA
jgi:hypothetical protein